jgi:ABC-2 type transport system ATP-binding protein
LDAVRLDQITKTFGQHTAVDQLSLVVPEGSIYGFIGPNGSGKTTTLRMLLHIIHPDTGGIEVLGEIGTRAANDSVSYLPEERGLYKKMKVRHLLAYYASLKGVSSSLAKQRGDVWLERFGLTGVSNQKVEALSKGMAQKLQFITTVLSEPKLLILDEPFSGLDPVNLEAVREAVLDLNRKGTTVIFSTHDMSMAEKMCDFIFMIYKGKKVLDGTLDAIQEEYATDTVRLRVEGGRDLLEMEPTVERVMDHGQYQEVRLSGDPQELLASLAGRTSVSLFEIARPSLHDIFVRIAGPEAGQASAQSQLSAANAD